MPLNQQKKTHRPKKLCSNQAEEPEPKGPEAGAPKKQEPESLQKFSGAGAGANKNMRLLYRLLEDKKHKKIVHLLLFFS